MEVILDVVLRSSMLVVLGFHFSEEAVLAGVAQEFLVAMTTVGLCQWRSGPNPMLVKGYSFNLVFCSE